MANYTTKQAFLSDNSIRTYSMYATYTETGSTRTVSIKNENIVHDSIEFTQILCAGDSLKFGECNADCLMFTCNKKVPIGAKLSFTTQSKLYDTIFNERTGTVYTGATENSKFIVDSCELSDKHAGLYTITAYRQSDIMPYGPNDYEEPDFETWKYKQEISSTEPIKVCIAGVTSNYISTARSYVSSYTCGTDSTLEKVITASNGSGQKIKIYCDEILFQDTNDVFYDSNSWYNRLYYMGKGQNLAEAKNLIKNTFISSGSFNKLSIDGALFLSDEQIKMLVYEGDLSAFVSYHSWGDSGSVSSYYKVKYDKYGTSEFIYPAGPLYTGLTRRYALIVPTKIEYYENGYVQNPVVTTSISFGDIRVSRYIIGTLRGVMYCGGQHSTTYDVTSIIKGYLEAYAQFGYAATNGDYLYTKTLSNVSSYIYPKTSGLYPKDTGSLLSLGTAGETISKECYEDIKVGAKSEPCGYVRVKYLSDGGDYCSTTIQIGTGSNVYDMRDNALLLNYIWTYDDVYTLITTNFAKVAAYAYYPITLRSKFLGWVNIGDEISIETDQGWINTFVISKKTTGDVLALDEIECYPIPINRNAEKWKQLVGVIERG